MLWRQIARLLCRRHSWVVDTWISSTDGQGKVVTRYRCRRCGLLRDAWETWPPTRRLHAVTDETGSELS